MVQEDLPVVSDDGAAILAYLSPGNRNNRSAEFNPMFGT
jgi:hypothetical protein